MIKTSTQDFAFYTLLRQFYVGHRGTIRSHFKELSRKFLDFNNPDKNPKAFLREPQFEALEIYVFLKEFLGNDKLERVFEDWFESKGKFTPRNQGGLIAVSQVDLVRDITRDDYKTVFAAMRKNSRAYPNYIFALTMGTGKTILMATCIFYEFLLANKFPKDERFCHNALVFAPDKTVLHSLREIESFDLALVVPTEYVNFLTAHLRFHYLEDTGTSLGTLDKSRFNVIVSNTQKIILKRNLQQKAAFDRLFEPAPDSLYDSALYEDAYAKLGVEQPLNEAELSTNQRFEKLTRLEQLGIYVDEAHHAFGNALAKDMGIGAKENDTSLRTTIDVLASRLEQSGTRVVACYNYTGTPYVGKSVLPEVVYAYGLRDAIDKGLLKKVVLHTYANTRSSEFVDIAVSRFIAETQELRPEGMLPKMAFFAATIEELKNDLRPAVESALLKQGISTDRVLVNVGDPKLTTNDEIREFNQLDTVESEKQFILLVGKGREGWNCRSLFSVALFRKPKSRIFVLQATMRCLRAIGQAQHTGHVFLSDENLEILNDELQDNFRISAEDLQKVATEKVRVQIRVTEPPVKVKLVRVRKEFSIRRKKLKHGTRLGLDQQDGSWANLVEKYRIIETVSDGFGSTYGGTTQDLTAVREKRAFSRLTLVAEIARYLNLSPLEVERILESTAEGTDAIVEMVNAFNELLYDEVVPRLFGVLYELDEVETKEEHEIELVKTPPDGYYEMSAAPDKIARKNTTPPGEAEKSFHVDTYCFDSNPEQTVFWDLIRDQRVKRIYFTGMLTHGQSDFFVQYIDPDSHTLRSYYPDFLFLRSEPDGSEKYVIVEVKGDHQVDDAVVLAKMDFAHQMAVASGMEYRMIKSSEANAGKYTQLLV